MPAHRSSEPPSPMCRSTVAVKAMVSRNVADRPITTPSGRARPDAAVAESSAGRTGSAQGLSAVPRRRPLR